MVSLHPAPEAWRPRTPAQQLAGREVKEVKGDRPWQIRSH